MSKCVLDSSALLAFLHRELGYETVGAVLEGAAMSTVNVAEVATKLADKGAVRIRESIRDLKIDIVDFDEELAYQVAALRPATRDFGLSLGDRACLATAQRFGLRAVTADRDWSRLKIGVEIQVIR